jgi:quercetin dioxygenase-like cupin family protein
MGKKPVKSESVGERIKSMREKQKLTVDQLAKKAGYEPDFIEQIESGDIAPPVGALIQISKAMAIESAALLAEDKKIERRKSYKKRTKSYSYTSLNPGSEDKSLWAYMVVLDPKKDHKMVEFKHEGEEFVYVLEGRVEVQVGKEANILKKGDSLHFDSSTPHNLRNLSTKKSRLLVVVYTP